MIFSLMIMIIVVAVILVANELVRSVSRVAKMCSAEILEVMKALLGFDGQGVVVTVVVRCHEGEVIVTAGVSRAVSSAISLNEIDVGKVTAVIAAVGLRTRRSTRDEGALDTARNANRVVVVESVLDLSGKGIDVAVIVMRLDDVPGFSALIVVAVGSAAIVLEEVECIDHSSLGGTIDIEAVLFGNLME